MYRDIVALASSKQHSEFEVQSDCYQYLKQRYPLVRGEVKVEIPRAKDENGKTIRRSGRKVRRERGARYDLVVYDITNQPIFTVEVKRKESYKHSKKEHYEFLSGVPSYLVGSLKQLEELVDTL